MNKALMENRLLHIDGLRGLAILLVLATHVWAFNGAPSLSVELFGHTFLLASVPAIGYVGVNLFLVLSGFCLAWPFMRDRTYRDQMSAGRFWLRRIRRIVPAYYVSIVLVLAISFVFDHLLWRATGAAVGASKVQAAVLPPLSDLSSHLLFVHNLSVHSASTINGSYWSLALEFQLYLMFPLLLEPMFRWGPWRVLVVVLAVQLSYRLYLEAALPTSVLAEFGFVLPKAMLGRMLDFVCGMAAAHFVAKEFRRHSRIRGAGWITAGALACLTAAFMLNYGQLVPSSLIDVLWSVGFAALVCGASAAQGFCNRLFCWRPLAALGVCSYSVYLLHQPLIERAAHLTLLFVRPGRAFLVGLALLPVIVALSVGFFTLCERPFLNYFTGKDRSRSAAARAKLESHAVPQVLEHAVG